MIVSFNQQTPSLGEEVYVAPNATVLGQVSLGDGVNIWYGTVLRGDVGSISIGARTNVQDLSVVHVTGGQFDTLVGAEVTIGHRAILHGCSIADHVLVGMGAIVMDGATVGEFSLIGAGALVTPKMVVPAGSLVLGSPAKVIRPTSDSERDWIRYCAEHYVQLATLHRENVVLG